MYFHHNIKYLRERGKMSQIEIAETLGVSSGSISAYESGRNYPTIENLLKLRKLFDANLEELFFTDLSQKQNITQSNNTDTVQELVQKVEVLQKWKSEVDGMLDKLAQVDNFDKVLNLFTDEMGMDLPELRKQVEEEAEKRLQEGEE